MLQRISFSSVFPLSTELPVQVREMTWPSVIGYAIYKSFLQVEEFRYYGWRELLFHVRELISDFIRGMVVPELLSEVTLLAGAFIKVRESTELLLEGRQLHGVFSTSKRVDLSFWELSWAFSSTTIQCYPTLVMSRFTVLHFEFTSVWLYVNILQ